MVGASRKEAGVGQLQGSGGNWGRRQKLRDKEVVIQAYKNFTAGWQWAGHEKIDERVTLSTSNVSLRGP